MTRITKEQFVKWYGTERQYVGSGERFLHDWIYCADGYYFSVQASEFHQSHPRRSEGPWTHFECGYPSEASFYFDADPVEGFVHIDKVIAEINLHGGLDWEAYE